MKSLTLAVTVTFLFSVAALVGCSNRTPEKAGPAAPAPSAEMKADNDEATIRANLAKLDPEDRVLAEQQQYCAVESKNRLGSMGVPYKVMIQGQPVFLCCDGCETRAKAHAERTLAKVQKLKDASETKPAQ